MLSALYVQAAKLMLAYRPNSLLLDRRQHALFEPTAYCSASPDPLQDV